MHIQCPHCGASGQLDDSRRPAGATTIKCPRCAQSFPIPPLPEPAAAVLPSSPSSPPPLRPCPSCGGPMDGNARLCSGCEASQERQTAQPVANSLPPPLPAAAAEIPGGTCEVCKGRFPQNDMVRFGTTLVCAGCKPTYVQMLAMGVGHSGDLRYAGFWIRFGAKIIDGIILWVVNMLATFGTTLLMAADKSSSAAIAAAIANIIIQMGVAIGYNAYFLSSKYQATPGKIACGLKVITADGGQVSALRGVGRYFAEILSSLIMMIGYIMVAFDDERRALHDRICNTRVVYK